MEKRKIFWILITVILSVLSLMLIVKLVFRTDKINEGKFRIADIVLTSTAELTDKTKQNDVWSLNVSQKNLLSILIDVASDANIEKIYLNDIRINEDKNVVFYLLNSENRIELNRKKQDLELEYTLDENGNIKLEIVALHENVIKNWAVPETLKEIVCDGRIFETAGISFKELQYTLKFKLNIFEHNGKVSTVNINLDLPNEELVLSGADVRRLDRTNFKFNVK